MIFSKLTNWSSYQTSSNNLFTLPLERVVVTLSDTQEFPNGKELCMNQAVGKDIGPLICRGDIFNFNFVRFHSTVRETG